MKNYFKAFVLLLTFILFTNCQKEEVQIQEQQVLFDSKDSKIKHSSFEELLNDPLFNTFTNDLELPKLTDKYRAVTKSSAAQGELTLITDAVNKIELGNKVSYSILAKREGGLENVVENVVLQDINGDKRSLLIKYKFKSKNEKSHLKTGGSLDVELDEVEMGDYPEDGNNNGSGGGNSTTTNCYYETIYIEFTCTSGEGHNYGEFCECGTSRFPNCNQPSRFSQQVEVCETVNNNIFGIWVNNNNTDGGGGPGGNSTYYEGTVDNISGISVFTPNTPDGSLYASITLELQSILGITDTSTLNWLNSRIEQETSIIRAFLRENNNSQEAKDFGKEAINAWIDDGEVDFDNQIIKDKSFIDTKADCVLNALINSGNNLFKKTSEAFTQGNSKYKIKFTTYNESGNTIAGAGLPDANNIITIKVNTENINVPSIEMASAILHETIHAELHRIYLTNNAGPNPLPAAQYNWYAQLWNIFGNGNLNRAATGAEHSYMAAYLINPMAVGIREFDSSTHPLENYKSFAWTGLGDRGKLNGYITKEELTRLENLSKIVRNDTHKNLCD